MGGSESLRISFLEAVYGFRLSFLSLCIFFGYEFNVMAVLFTKRYCFENIGKKRDYCGVYL